MKDSISLEVLLLSKPSTIYKDWLLSKSHTKMTGGEAEIKPVEGSFFTAWDGYITGKIIELIPNKKIIQRWRTTEFADTDEDSILEIIFEEVDTGTKLILKQTNIPAGDGFKYKAGWQEYYFKPMKNYYNEEH